MPNTAGGSSPLLQGDIEEGKTKTPAARTPERSRSRDPRTATAGEGGNNTNHNTSSVLSTTTHSPSSNHVKIDVGIELNSSDSKEGANMPNSGAAVAASTTKEDAALAQQPLLPVPASSAPPPPPPPSALERVNNALPGLLIRASLVAAALLALWRLFPLSPFPLTSSLRTCQDLVNRAGAWQVPTSVPPQSASFFLSENAGVLHSYKGKDIAKCVAETDWHFVGDSRARELMLEVATRTLSKGDEPIKYEKHADFTKEVGTGKLVFNWDPFGNTTLATTLLPKLGKSEGRRTVVVASLGMWHLRFQTANALPSYKALLSLLADSVSPADENGFYLWPPSHVQPSKLDDDRRASLTNEAIDQLSTALFDFPQLTDKPNVHVARTWKSLLDGGVQLEREGLLVATTDGLHYSPLLVTSTADYLLNHACNEIVLAGVNTKSTVCGAGAGWKWGQIFSLLVMLGLGGAGFVASRDATSLPPFLHFITPKLGWSFILSLIPVLACLLADRSFWLAASPKLISVPRLLGTLALSGIPSLMSLNYFQPSAKNPDGGFMNRDQTEEWRGWMQIIVLAYHYTGGSKVGWVYAGVRVLVGAYLFMTGYGHASYFLVKKTYPPSRLINLLLRLNVLPLLLSFALDAPFLGYYFSPLVSAWFLAIWITFWPLNSMNSTWVLPAKIVVVWGAMWYFHAVDTRIWVWLFGLFKTVGIDWDAREWGFRVALDCWAPLMGIATAWVVVNWDRVCTVLGNPRFGGIVEAGYVRPRAAFAIGLLSMTAWMGVWAASKDKFDYNTRHPWASLFPIIGFVALRNATTGLRGVHSGFLAWVGKISLETFILQFHIWLAMDTKAILVYLPGNGIVWWINLAIATGVFLWVCEAAGKGTGELVDWVISGGVRGKEDGMWTRVAGTALVFGVCQAVYALAG